VIDRHEVDLGRAVSRVGDKPGVSLDERLVENGLERLREDLPRSRDMLGDRRGVGDHLVLKRA
jgi:hypothetical protein